MGKAQQFLSILGRDHCFSYLGPQHSSVISFTTNRGQLLYPLMGKFLAKFSLEYLVCTRSYKLYPQHVCFVVSQSFFFFFKILSPPVLLPTVLSLYLSLLLFLFSDADLLQYVKVKTY